MAICNHNLVESKCPVCTNTAGDPTFEKIKALEERVAILESTLDQMLVVLTGGSPFTSRPFNYDE